MKVTGTLADVIGDLIETPIDRMHHGMYEKLYADIQSAMRFVIEPSCIEACEHLLSSKPSSLLAAVNLVKLPFDNCWIEWAPQGSERPLRAGALVKKTQDGVLEACFAWLPSPKQAKVLDSDRDKLFQSKAVAVVNPVGIEFNFTQRRPRRLESDSKWAEKCSAPELSALETLNGFFRPIAPKCALSFLQAIPAAQVNAAIKRYSRRTSGSAAHLFGLIALINSRTYVELIQADLISEKQRRRDKKQKPPLSYRAVRLNLSRRDIRTAAHDNLSDMQIRSHIVRGHFKIRSSGIFWWRPFLRGDETVGRVERTGYIVENAR